MYMYVYMYMYLKHTTSGRQDMSIIILCVLRIPSCTFCVVCCILYYIHLQYPCFAICYGTAKHTGSGRQDMSIIKSKCCVCNIFYMICCKLYIDNIFHHILLHAIVYAKPTSSARRDMSIIKLSPNQKISHIL